MLGHVVDIVASGERQLPVRLTLEALKADDTAAKRFNQKKAQ
jgi:hypothetical protein